MSVNVLFSAPEGQWAAYEGPLAKACADRALDVRISPELAADDVDYVVFAPGGAVDDFSVFPRLKAAFGLWAGVESIVRNPTLTVPLTRMVEDGLTRGMTEWVVGHVLARHLGMDENRRRQRSRIWQPVYPPIAPEVSVTVLGLGELGTAAARALAGLGFRVCGWSRRPREIEGIECLSGESGFAEALSVAQYLVLLLPLTPQTQAVIDARALAMLPKGAVLLNPGRGGLIDDDALLTALDSGHVSHAVLDVFRTEPLPQDSRFWDHPRVTVTPHVAAETRPATASAVIAENLARAEAGKPLLFLVDRKAGY